ncbi:MAG: hypothetical protein IBJ00_04510, partial [Alphaproteobacteria bacterium]|nr:hypothetical protein [Alphaproteobacteria bacterium]
ANVVALPNDWYDTIFKAASNSGGSIEKIGQAVGEKFGGALDNVSSVVPEPRVQAIMKAAALATQGVGVATEAIGSLVGIVGSVIRASSCKNMSFIATKTTDDDYTVSLLTRQQ